MQRSVSVIVPVYNEEKVVGAVVKGIRAAGPFRVIVVDDGSSDRTAHEARGAGATVLRHMLNRGKGAAVTTGIQAAILQVSDIVITMDGDGQHNPRDIPSLIDGLRGHDVVLGVRTKNKHAMPLARKLANAVGNAATWLFYGIWVRDSQCGFRAYSQKAFMRMNTVHDRYEYDSEVIRELGRHKLTYTEVPVEAVYTDYSLNKRYRQSMLNGIRMIYRLLLSA